MSESNSETKIPWGQRELRVRDLILLAGLIGFLLVGSGAILAYIYLNQPEEMPVAEATPAPVIRP